MKHFLPLAFFIMTSNVLANQMSVTREFCDKYVVTEHKPDDDVAYKPDPDMGPPADIGGSLTVKLPKTFSIPINIDMSKYMGSLGNPPNSFLNYAELGHVTVQEDGRIYFNGQPLFSEDEFAIKQACRRLRD